MKETMYEKTKAYFNEIRTDELPEGAVEEMEWEDFAIHMRQCRRLRGHKILNGFTITDLTKGALERRRMKKRRTPNLRQLSLVRTVELGNMKVKVS